jgi:hypothetical protein
MVGQGKAISTGCRRRTRWLGLLNWVIAKTDRTHGNFAL